MSSFTRLCMPGKIISGNGCIQKTGALAEDLGGKKACLIFDAALEDSVYRNKVVQNLNSFGVKINQFITISSEPTVQQLQYLLGNNGVLTCDLMIAIGGGSTLDTGKLLSAAVTNSIFAQELKDGSKIKQSPLPFIAVPTTAGTGAEATPNAILLDELTHEKVAIINTKMIPDIILLDSNLTEHLPFSIAVSTGFDALAHALESYTSINKNDFTSLFALESIRTIFSYLEDACINNQSVSRQKMLEASFYAGVCLTTSSTHVVHAMAYPLSSRYGIRHGPSISILLSPVIKALHPQCSQSFSEIGRSCLDLQPDISDQQASISLVNKICDMATRLSVPTNFSYLGIDHKEIKTLAREALQNKRLFDNSPVRLSDNDVQRIYEEVIV